ncbi:unnamed protein product [Vitrella brassicaformis CCMP3155]|uniref:Uncharacterized protein n=1 Tax=Vitrella brassicaformis (strain CCMP3155) TaxID=1169540 RepID=A0A0G4FCH8_VITBC|nr:unnamed protein product [Vitrella brassicaformis CCMP3155]|eukprot:CEM10482.1 unnamed protein product [Vitrella brassicaformis CCMP3155]
MLAFQIICSHLLNHYKDLRDNKYVAPLRMCLTGEFGTGKTVMKVVKACSAELQCRHWLCLAALTGVAADNTEGSTIDSLLHGLEVTVPHAVLFQMGHRRQQLTEHPAQHGRREASGVGLTPEAVKRVDLGA